jgi:hypothetical protein
MLRVTAVFFADDDGGRATGVLKQGGTVMPKEGLLRDSAIHTKISENFIDDWISLANKQLFVSGADFLLDRANVRYVLEKNTLLNTFNSAADAQPMLDFISAKQKKSGDNPWKDSILLIFPWGAGAEPDEQGFSSAGSPYIKMAAKYHDFEAKPRFVDGSPVPGNNLLTHELGHYLGLAHNFSGVQFDMPARNTSVCPPIVPLRTAVRTSSSEREPITLRSVVTVSCSTAVM